MQIIKRILPIFLCTFIFGADFIGKLGRTYDIGEEDGQSQIERKMEKISPKGIKQEVQKSINLALNPNNMLPLCQMDKIKEIDVWKKVEEEAKRRNIDLTLPQNKTKMDLVFNFIGVHMLVLDVLDKRQVAYARSNGFKEVIVSNGYVYDSSLEDFVSKSYVLQKHFIQDFHLSCVPSAIGFNTKTRKIEIKEIDVSKK